MATLAKTLALDNRQTDLLSGTPRLAGCEELEGAWIRDTRRFNVLTRKRTEDGIVGNISSCWKSLPQTLQK